MNKHTENKLIPELRFPEFRDSGEWYEETLKGATLDLLDGDWIESKDQSSKGIRLIQTGNVGIGEFLMKIQHARYISEETFERLRCTEIFPGDCIVSRLPEPVGRACFLPDIGERMITGVDCMIVKFNEEKIVPSLFVSYSQTEKYVSEVKALASGSTRERVSKDNLSRIKIPLTKLKEQQKIADCLSSLDDLITAENGKLKALKAHKKGLMQQLFPAEGETVPRLRFKGFEGEWEEKTLGELVEINSGVSPSNYTLSDFGEFPFLKVEDLNNCEKYQLKSREYSNDRKNRTPSKSVIFPKRGASILLNKARINPEEVLMDSNLMAITPNDKTIVEFLYYLVLKEGLHRIADTSSIPQINNKHIIPYAVLMPPKREEQEEVANCLSAVDELITAETDKIENLKLHKKGLMQQLFPNTNNITNE